MLYYLFSAHNWGLADLRALWEGETGWPDLILALSSLEPNQRAEARTGAPPKKALKATKTDTRVPRWVLESGLCEHPNQKSKGRCAKN